jgi:hypothetical protein
VVAKAGCYVDAIRRPAVPGAVEPAAAMAGPCFAFHSLFPHRNAETEVDAAVAGCYAVATR